MKEMVYKFFDEGKREHEETRAFVSEFKTTNELLFKERNNSLSELRFEVYGLSKVIDNALISNYEAKGVTTIGGKMKTHDLRASISLILYTMYEKLGLGELKPTRMSLEIVDRMPIQRIDPINTPYSKAQKTTRTDGFISGHLYSASANEINEKKPELKDLPHHLEYTYLHGECRSDYATHYAKHMQLFKDA
nr:hypothetical protein [Tanacetum cinerariifolium]